MIRLLPLKFFACLLFTQLHADLNKKLYPLEYKTTDGWTIHAKLRVSVKPDKPLLVAIHGIWYDQSTVPCNSKLLKRFNLLTIDIRGHGLSTQYRGKTTEWKSGKGNIYFGSFQDIAKGIEQVKRLTTLKNLRIDYNRLFFMGSSYSGVLELQFQQKYKLNLKGIILVSAGISYQQRPGRAYEKLIKRGVDAPIYFICATGDLYCHRSYYEIKKLSYQSKYHKKSKFLFVKNHLHGYELMRANQNHYLNQALLWSDSLEKKDTVVSLSALKPSHLPETSKRGELFSLSLDFDYALYGYNGVRLSGTISTTNRLFFHAPMAQITIQNQGKQYISLNSLVLPFLLCANLVGLDTLLGKGLLLPSAMNALGNLSFGFRLTPRIFVELTNYSDFYFDQEIKTKLAAAMRLGYHYQSLRFSLGIAYSPCLVEPCSKQETRKEAYFNSNISYLMF